MILATFAYQVYNHELEYKGESYLLLKLILELPLVLLKPNEQKIV